ncbi:hypothetical protein Tco_0410974 [Tanacetum coccineum]
MRVVESPFGFSVQCLKVEDDGVELLEVMKGKRFGRDVDVRSCLGRLKEDCDAENMSESQQSVLQGVEDYVERLHVT